MYANVDRLNLSDIVILEASSEFARAEELHVQLCAKYKYTIFDKYTRLIDSYFTLNQSTTLVRYCRSLVTVTAFYELNQQKRQSRLTFH